MFKKKRRLLTPYLPLFADAVLSESMCPQRLSSVLVADGKILINAFCRCGDKADGIMPVKEDVDVETVE